MPDSAIAGSPLSQVGFLDGHEKAEQVLELLVQSLTIPTYHAQFAATLPLTRICLLLLGEKPSSFVASQILLLIAISVNKTITFARKFELISGWNVLKHVLPECWDPSVHEAAFDVLLGRVHGQKLANGNGPASGNTFKSPVEVTPNPVVCPAIVAPILSSLRVGLNKLAYSYQTSSHLDGKLGNVVLALTYTSRSGIIDYRVGVCDGSAHRRTNGFARI